jgi:hypothetical protein
MSRETLIPLFAWLGHTGVGETIRSSAALIALTEIIHLLGLTMLIGTVLMVDMALLGFGIRRHPASRIAAELAPWTIGGLVVMLISGPLILSSETLKCYDASFFWIKMAVLLVAIVFHFTVHRRVTRSEPPPGRFRAGIVACVSLGLWIAVALAGKMIGIYGDDLRVEPAPFQVRLYANSPTASLSVRSGTFPRAPFAIRASSRAAPARP